MHAPARPPACVCVARSYRRIAEQCYAEIPEMRPCMPDLYDMLDALQEQLCPEVRCMHGCFIHSCMHIWPWLGCTLREVVIACMLGRACSGDHMHACMHAAAVHSHNVGHMTGRGPLRLEHF